MTRPPMTPQPPAPQVLPKALGYLRTDVSGPNWQQDEQAILALATRLGYDLVKTVRMNPEIHDPLSRLLIIVRRLDIAAVITPTLEHIGGPGRVCRVCSLITIAPEYDWALAYKPSDGSGQ
ncbi:hypothetical protein OHA40_11135 [Nocardia sp. NBC_00508]|uniref:hypothetical protein n=1 Tax=Nocardia sp. NBC_00508 TaxID=2975992 RepID=UPI002E823A22|nr:hypothetical protein [Nocardia sp. NBC_00508]WUD68611.1 hypothetical protein OHA40_11135 [Nocardia sp. NBC_00508]